MPQLAEKNLKSLCQICVECVSDNMDKLCKIWTCKQPDVVGPEINNNPFELLRKLPTFAFYDETVSPNYYSLFLIPTFSRRKIGGNHKVTKH